MSANPNIDLRRIARQAMLDRGFLVEFPPAALRQAQAAGEPDFKSSTTRDLSALLWSSIDNDDSKDLDQIEYSESINEGFRVYVGIADVNTLVSKDSAVDQFARHNTTSIYTGITTFPMLPQRFSNDLTSLNENFKRLAVVIEMEIAANGAVTKSTVYSAVVHNKAQLTYHAVGVWLDNAQAEGSQSARTQEVLAKINGDPELQKQLLIQDKICQTLKDKRLKEGALDFKTLELQPRVGGDGQIELSTHELNRASQIIEELMIVSNECVDQFLQSKNIPSLQRVVRTPKNWPRMVALAAEHGGKLPPEPNGKSLEKFLEAQRKADPDQFPDLSLAMIKLMGRGEYVVKTPGSAGIGHFGLAAAHYSHTTAPNRRYPDLIMQRLLAAAFRNQPSPYSTYELTQLAMHCTTKEDDANRVERLVTKCLAAISLAGRIGEIFDGIITGASEKGVFVRLQSLPIEGKVEGGIRNLEVGMHVRVKLMRTDPYRGFIDFEVVRGAAHDR